ncbi:T9SS type A sorting domain-containing protein [Cesiribacter andamanensis]|uniref:Secretion system C-terminal sorting domain-containing protein n=1 Tax=Cesiribacter andamanensis AMV16 TaxID=1279009 RepID=M7NYA6_9BACT|nr:T9SS type A sorting domain-containing protein [Cesiribacter andamanensis]EMR03359.1 hypothetical protein ADICEAN_01462 [Cesiribacter andamanensis AMV16]
MNYLWPAQDVRIRLSSLHPQVSVPQPEQALGSMGMLQQLELAEEGFVIDLHPDLSPNAEIVLRLDYSAAGYEDFQFIRVLLNPSFYTLRENKIATTISGTGRVGYEDGAKTRGIGFEFQEENMLYEMGLMIGVDSQRVVSSVRAQSGIHDDFVELERLERQEPGTIADVEVSGRFTDARAYHTRQLGVEVAYRIYAWREAPHDQSLLFIYKIYNRTAAPLEKLVVGYFADWDINPQGYKDLADWDPNTQTALVYAAPKEGRRVAGVQLLGATPNYWAMDNTTHLQEGNIGVYDGFTEAEKYKALSSGIANPRAGEPEQGSDVSIALGAGPFSLAPGDSLTVAFALHGAGSIDELLAAAAHIQDLWEHTAGLHTPTGLVANSLPGLQLYPNPSRGEVTLHWPEQQQLPYTLRVFDRAGRLVQVQQATGAGAGGIRLQLPPQGGLYLLEVQQGGRRALRRVLVH